MAVLPNGRRASSPASSFRTFTIGFFAGLVCFAFMTFYISDLSIQHTTSMSSSSSSGNNNFLNAMSATSQQQQQPSASTKGNDANDNALAGLSCDAYGGPSNDVAQEMVYWQDIPSDRYEREILQPYYINSFPALRSCLIHT